MSILKIAWRSIQHRGLGSVLTILSMALGVMLVVAVLTVHGVVSQSFKSISTFPYDLIVATSGSGMQVTMNTTFYLSSPVENIPYEFYLAFCDEERRQDQLRYSVAYQSRLMRERSEQLADKLSGVGSPFSSFIDLALQSTRSAEHTLDDVRIFGPPNDRDGKIKFLCEMAIPVNLGDYLDRFRVVGTVPEFFTEIYLDYDTKKQMSFSDGRAFEEFNNQHGFFEAVLGATVAKELNLGVGDVINPIHGDPNSPGAHTHEQGFTIVGVLDTTGLPHDRATFVNLEGFFLMEDHAAETESKTFLDPLLDTPAVKVETSTEDLRRVRLPIEQREVTAILVRSLQSDPEAEEDEDEDDEDEWEDDNSTAAATSFAIKASVDEGGLKDQLNWSDYRPLRSKDQIQAVSPVMEVTLLLINFVNPLRWILLLLTIMICVVSGISILVGIYNSMSQRKHEIAVMRALGASRSKVLMVTLMESVTLAILGGLIGWIAGHGLNALASPFVEERTGVAIGFFDFAPGIPLLSWLGETSIPFSDNGGLEWVTVSPELLLIPGLIILAIAVGIYPAMTAYRTDVAESLGS